MMMRKFKILAGVGVVLSGLALGACATGDASEVDPTEAVKKQFVGNYELLHFYNFAADGTARDMNYSGRIMYDEHGNMSAIGMLKNFPERAGSAPEPVSRGGFAYYGTWDIDAADSRVTHHVHGSPSNAGWPGTDLVRYYEFIGTDQLALSIRDETGRVTGTLTWRRYP
jgi:hypothetical protein